MKRFLLLLLLLAVAVGAQSQSGDTSLDGSATTTIDLIANAGESVLISADVTPTAGESVVDVDFIFTKDGESFQIREVDSAGSVYFASLHVDDVRVTTGSWTVRAKVISSDGSIGFADPATLVVIAADAPPLKAGFGADELTSGTRVPTLTVGANAQLPYFVNISNENQLMKRVTAGSNGLESVIPYPYTILLDGYSEGSHAFSITAEDRLGRFSVLYQSLFIDRTEPVLDVGATETAFIGLEYLVELDIVDATDVNVIVQFGNQTQTAIGKSLEFKFADISDEDNQTVSLFIYAEDEVGNSASRSQQVTFLRPPLELNFELTMASPHILAGDDTSFTVNGSYDSALSEIPVQLVWSNASSREESLLLSSDFAHTSVFSFAPGKYSLQLNITLPTNVNTTALAGAIQEFEAFIGKIVDGDKEYFIRANERGLPIEAVHKNQTFNLILVEQGSVDVYELEGTTLAWNPQEKVTTVPTPQSSSGDSDGAEETPFVPTILLVLAMLLWVRRR